MQDRLVSRSILHAERAAWRGGTRKAPRNRGVSGGGVVNVRPDYRTLVGRGPVVRVFVEVVDDVAAQFQHLRVRLRGAVPDR